MKVAELGAPGPTFRRSLVFRLLYLPLALFYIALVLFWGRYDLARVYREYCTVAGQLNSSYAQEKASREVAAGCRQTAGGEGAPGYGDCLRASSHLVESRAAVIGAGLLRERQQVIKKLLGFYGLVGLVLIVLPLALLYAIMVFSRYLLSNIRFKKE